MGDWMEMSQMEMGGVRRRTLEKSQQTTTTPSTPARRAFLRLPHRLKCPLPSCPCIHKDRGDRGINPDKPKTRGTLFKGKEINLSLRKSQRKSKEGTSKEELHWDSLLWENVRRECAKESERKGREGGMEIKRSSSVMKEKKKSPSVKDHDVCYKVLLIGDSGVGKTALVRSLMGQDFQGKTLTTVGMDFVNTILEVDGARIKLQVWDTAGQERFRSMTRFQFRGTQGALLAYDLTDRESYKTLKYWLELIDSEIDQYNKEPIPVFLIGNKADIPEKRQVPYKKGIQLSEEHLMRGFMETSAKTNKNVIEAFAQLAQAIVEINNPKLLDSFLDPLERTEKYEEKKKEAEVIAQYQLQKQRSRIRLPSNISRVKNVERIQNCCNS